MHKNIAAARFAMYQWVTAMAETLYPDASAYVRRSAAHPRHRRWTSNVSLRYGFGNPKRIAPHNQPRCGPD